MFEPFISLIKVF